MNLLQNPFHILNATPRDNRRRIVDLADERSLLLSSSECIQARSDLTNPRKRLSAEIAWLPALSPKNAEKILTWLSEPVETIFPSSTLNVLSPIARANTLASGLQKLARHNSSNVIEWILKLAWAFEGIDPEELCSVINEERIIAGFPEVTDLSAVDAEIKERRRYYKQTIKSALDNMFAKELVKVMTEVVKSSTNDGEAHGPILIHDVVDSYEIEAQEFLEKEEENIKTLVEKLRAAVDAERPDSTLAPKVNQLIQVVKNWDTVAQPIQVSAKSRGPDHDASNRIAGLVRDLAIDMFNEYDKLDFSQQLTGMLKEVFAEVGGVAELVAKDGDTLSEIAERTKLSRLLDSISEICRAALDNIEKHHSSAEKEAQKVMSAAPQLIADLASSKPGIEILSQGKDKLALTLMHCAVLYGNKTEKWKPCITFLEEALKYASSQDVKSRVQKNLGTVKENDRLFGDLKPIYSAPSLYRIYGIGMELYGSTDHDPAANSHLSTYYFVFFLIPIFPICRYRVIPTGNGYRFLGKAPLRTFDKLHLFFALALMAVFALYIALENNSGTIYRSNASSPSHGISSPRQSYDKKSNRGTLSREIETGKTRASQMEAQIKDLDDRLEDYEGRMRSYRASGKRDEYNLLIPSFNSLVNERNEIYKKYSNLISEVNAKVKRYNSGYR